MTSATPARPSEIRTTDTQIASFLVAIGHPLKSIVGPRQRREFIFGIEAAEDFAAYFTDTKLVAPRKLFSALRDVRAALFALP
jgi:hypothetical protein